MHPFPIVMPALPEMVMAVAGMALLMAGVFTGDRSSKMLSWLAILLFGVVGILVATGADGRQLAFDGLFVADPFGAFMKLLVLLGAALALLLSIAFNAREGIARFEYPVLFVFATLGMMMMVSANDLISLYVGLELQSLCLYVVAAYRRDTVRSTEAGLKYFVLGALSSGMLLYGASLVYGFSGTTRFETLALVLGTDGGGSSIGLLVGLVFVAAGLAFKISAVPFHMWTPDVYEGAPTPVTAFFAAAPKIAAMALMIRVLVEPFGEMVGDWRQIVVFLSIASMALGAYAAIGQENIKRLMAYSSIGHVGYALVGLAAAGPSGVRGVLIYLAIYLPMVIGTFACILCMRQRGRMVEGVSDLAGLARSQPGLALALAVFMFSMAGIPPLAGFFGKLYVFLAAIEAGLYTLAVIGVLTSVVAAYYYLRIIKIMYFDEPVDAFDRPIGRATGTVLAATGLFNMLFFIHPTPLLTAAAAAAASLFAPG